MATNDLSTKEKICNAALALLRQDVGYNEYGTIVSNSVAAKCDNAWTLAYGAVASAHEWRELQNSQIINPQTGEASPASLSQMLRQLLVYSLARELAIPITGRQEDLKAVDALYTTRLKDAVAKDLDDEMDALRASDDADRKFAAEVLDILRQYHSEHDDARSAPRTRGVEQMVRHISSIKETIRLSVLTSHDWGFATDEARAFSRRLKDGRWETDVPGDALRVVKCYSGECEKAESFMRNGDTLVTHRPLERIVYTYDPGAADTWPPTARRAYLYKVVQAVALASPELTKNPYRTNEIDKAVAAAVQEARTADARQTHNGTSAYGRNYLYDVATGKRRHKWYGGRL